MSRSSPQISIMELSIADIHARFAQGSLTCTELTQGLLQRIECYDLEEYAAAADGTQSAAYLRQWWRRAALRQAVMTALAAHDLDALLYPHQQGLVAPIGEEQRERNGVLSHGTGFPALTFPGGFSRPTPGAPLGVPIGIELLGPAWSEPLLLRLAYAFEPAAQLRRLPTSTPECMG